MIEYFIGIDPGKTGGIGIITPDKIEAIETPINAKKEIDISYINTYLALEVILRAKTNTRIFCCIEKSTAMPKQGVVSMFKYGVTYGKLIAILEILQIPYEEVLPRKWKKDFSLDSDKRKSIITAQKLFPAMRGQFTTERGRIKDGAAEALLLAEYARRIYK
jgi:crossover junction endodeoxyribonuclease RuvC